MLNDRRFYVYALLDRGKVFYVGKGTGRRVLRHRYEAAAGSTRSPYLYAKIRNLWSEGRDYTWEFLDSKLTDAEALEREQLYIAGYGRANLCNLTDGGEGNSGHKHTAETRAKMSAAHKKFTDEERRARYYARTVEWRRNNAARNNALNLAWQRTNKEAVNAKRREKRKAARDAAQKG